MRFKFIELEIPGLVLIEPLIFDDERGFFLEFYKYSEFNQHGIKEFFVQDNHSKSSYGVLRGLHYQNPPKDQGKLVRVIKGEIYDVAVDIRRGSPTYGKWIGVNLSERNKQMLYIPPGFAHGFCVLSVEAEVIYKCTNEYDPSLEAGIIWNDPEISIQWPIEELMISEKDRRWPNLNNANNYFVYGGVSK